VWVWVGFLCVCGHRRGGGVGRRVGGWGPGGRGGVGKADAGWVCGLGVVFGWGLCGPGVGVCG